MLTTPRPVRDLPLDSSMYSPREEEKIFFKAATGIQDDDELKEHVIAVQAKAVEVYKYSCIRTFGFTKLRIAHVPGYLQFLELGRQREGAILLDMGCCLGSDVRKAVRDGWPMKGVIAADLRKDFWDLGHELFRSTPETFPVPFLQGDIFDPAFLTQVPVLPTSSTPPIPHIPPLTEVTSLNELHGKFSAIFAGAFFHLFTFDGQEQIARRLAGLLSPLPGSMIFGRHNGQPEKRVFNSEVRSGIHCHSPESWRELWEGIFAEVGAKVEVNGRLRSRLHNELFVHGASNVDQRYFLEWSVIRV